MNTRRAMWVPTDRGHRQPRRNLGEPALWRAHAARGSWPFLVATIVLVIALAAAGSFGLLPADARQSLVLAAFLIVWGPVMALWATTNLWRWEWPASRALSWAADVQDRWWRSLDGQPPSTAPEAGLTRLGQRSDDEATDWRIRLLHTLGRTDEARQAFAWHPAGLAAQAARARTEYSLGWGGPRGLEAAWAAAARLEDRVSRVGAQAQVLLADASLRLDAGLDPFPRMVQAGRLLQETNTTFGPYWSKARRIWLRRLAAWALLPSVAAVALVALRPF